MNSLTSLELRFFLGIQAMCLFVATLSIVYRNMLMPISNQVTVICWLVTMFLLGCLLSGVIAQSLIRRNEKKNLLLILGLYGVISVVIVPMLFL